MATASVRHEKVIRTEHYISIHLSVEEARALLDFLTVHTGSDGPIMKVLRGVLDNPNLKGE